MTPSQFNTIYKETTANLFEKPITVTQTRKLIAREISMKPKDVQRAVARAEGHSVEVQEKFYDITDPGTIVEKARNVLEQIAKDDIETTDPKKADDSSKPCHQKTSDVVSENSVGSTTPDEEEVFMDEPAHIQYLKVEFVDDDLTCYIYRINDIKSACRRRVKSFTDIKIGDTVYARWPEDKLFYQAKVIDPSVSPRKTMRRNSDSMSVVTPSKNKPGSTVKQRRNSGGAQSGSHLELK
uniref:Uncharacterized protein LOC104265522 n=1 Tax=Phallusia mammillata TaxID=59560 RepID=A0A6F9DJP3_9ASCI|nr:uncharacterized protein LOC104265522 [Phallusia mammillata]